MNTNNSSNIIPFLSFVSLEKYSNDSVFNILSEDLFYIEEIFEKIYLILKTSDYYKEDIKKHILKKYPSINFKQIEDNIFVLENIKLYDEKITDFIKIFLINYNFKENYNLYYYFKLHIVFTDY